VSYTVGDKGTKLFGVCEDGTDPTHGRTAAHTIPGQHHRLQRVRPLPAAL
jgi:hypothetical protein